MGSMGKDINPELGSIASPHTGVGYWQTFAMRPRDVLANNLRKLMAATPSLSKFPQITAAGGGTNGTLDRIRRKVSAAGVDTVGELAQVYGLTAWQLLSPDLEAAEGDDGRPVITGLPDWPFPMVSRSRYEALPIDAKGFVQGRLVQAIEECEARLPAKSKLMSKITGPAVSDEHVAKHLPPAPSRATATYNALKTQPRLSQPKPKKKSA